MTEEFGPGVVASPTGMTHCVSSASRLGKTLTLCSAYIEERVGWHYVDPDLEVRCRSCQAVLERS